MAIGDPIRLGSALNSTRLIFQDGSSITTGKSGIQECSIKALCTDAKNVFNFIPKAGDSYNTVFGNDYLPVDFKVDFTGGGAQITYDKGNSATVTLTFKRPDPATVAPGGGAPPGQNGRTISVDSAINYKNIFTNTITSVSGETLPLIAVPEPIVTVKYNSVNRPIMGVLPFDTLYALPNDARATGFPVLGNVHSQFAGEVPNGTSITYWNGTEFVTFTSVGTMIFGAGLTFVPNPLGWQLTGLKSAPVSGEAFFDCEEDWRCIYFLAFGEQTGP